MDINNTNNNNISDHGTTSQTIISKETFRRLVKDVKELIINPLFSHKIYYTHNEDNILKGKALIIGPSDTPYENGFYLFDFTFPQNYPHSPPVVSFCTNDGETRFNPNLYKNKKVCISILNTWQGEQWTGCQTISSILLALCSLLNDKPLLNEPGITEKHQDYKTYNYIIIYKNFETAMLSVLNNEYTKKEFPMFYDIIQEHFLSNFNSNIERLTKLYTLFPKKELLKTSIYSMNILTDYNKLLNNFHKVKQKHENENKNENKSPDVPVE